MTPLVVVGAGHSGFGLAGDLALRGARVRLLDHPDYAAAMAPLAEAGLSVRGIRGEGTVVLEWVGSDPAEALAGVALAFRRAVRAHGGPNLTVAEASSFIFACKKDGPAGVWIRGVKHGLPVGVLPARDTERVMAMVAPHYPELRAAADVLETSLSNVNHPAHPPAFLLNIARIESSGPDFSFFHEGMTPSVCRLTDALDAERMRVMDALGYSPESVLAQLVRYYGDQGFGGASYYQAVSTTPVHGAVRAPANIHHRYFTEDVPYGLVPTVSWRVWMPRGCANSCVKGDAHDA